VPILSIQRCSQLLGLLCASLTAFGVAASASAPPAAAAQTAAVQAHLMWARYDAAGRERQLDLVKASGAGMARVDVGWASLERDGKGRWEPWYLSKLDHVVGEAEERGIELLLTFWETPCWASSAPAEAKQGCAGAWWDRGVQRHPPVNAADYADALAFLIRRYGNRVAAWEIWNEPNHDHYFKATDKVGSYTALVRAAYPAAKAADPSSTILAGSLADADYAFTDAALTRGAAGHFDAWSVHPYSEDRSPLHPGVAGWEKKSLSSGVPRVREALLRHGQDKPLWLTELGWSTCSVRGRAAYENCVDPATQARYLGEAFAKIRDWSYVPVAVWFNLEDTAANPAERLDNYGLLTWSGEPKPAFHAFQAAARGMGSGTPALAGAGARSSASGPGAGPGAKAAGGRAAVRGRTRALRAPASRRRGLVVRAARRHGRLWVRGRVRHGRSVRIRVHRWSGGAGRFSRRSSLKAVVLVRPDGRFRRSIAAQRLPRGRLLVVARAGRDPVRVARARVR
jgi:hypothetical protein